MKTLKTILLILVPILSYGQLTPTLSDNKVSKYQKWAGTGKDLQYVSYSGFFLSGIAGGMEFKNNERGIYQTKWTQVQKVSFGLSSVAGGCSIYFTRKEKHKVGKALLQIAYSATFFYLGKQTGKYLNR